MKFEFSGDTQNGILKYLFNTYRNDYQNQVLSYSTSQGVGYESTCATDFNPLSYWHIIDHSPIGQYLVIHLPNYYIKMDGYSITTSRFDASDGTAHPKNWGFDASNDNETWFHQRNISDTTEIMNHANATIYVPWNFGTYKYFRLMMTGEQHDKQGKNGCDITQVEFFGELLTYIPRTNLCTQTTKTRFISFLLFTIFLQE